MDMIGRARVSRANDTTIAWGELGSGPPLILLHGLGDSHRTWRRAAPRLAERFRVLMPDLPGHGLSGRPDAPYTLDWYARTMSAWMGSIGVESAHFGGHSFGGGVAQWLLLEQRSRIDRLALVAAGGLGREVGFGLRLASFPILGPLLAPPLMRVGTKLMMHVAHGAFANPEPDEIDRLAWMNTAPRTGRAFQRTVAGCIDLFGQTMQTWQRIHEIELPPIALFWGDRDPIIPIKHAIETRARVDFASVSTYQGCGHFPHLEQTERFTRELVEFLDDDTRLPGRLVLRLPITVRRRGPRAAIGRFFRRTFGAMRKAIAKLSIH